jgi:multidrug efflux pump subunit AcrA (membrane-fusion protein)
VDGTAATPVIELATTSAEFDADATDRQLAGIAPGQPATVTTSAGGLPIAGTVRGRSAALDPATGLGFVRVAIDPPAPLTLGSFGTVTIETRVRDGVLVVPADAMRGAVADGAEVVVCADAKSEIRAVRVGWRGDDRVEIAGGLAEGERVAVDHVLGLQTGSPIIEAKP